MTEPDLKPCPFCGGDKNVICKTDYDGRDAYAVSCRYHECHGAIFMLGYGYFSTKDKAIAAWNTRAVDPATIREVSEADNIAIRNAALREAAAAVSELADHAVTALAYEHAHACRDEILDLIGEKK